MTNILNSVINNKHINNPAMQATPNAAFTFDTKGKVKPLEDKAQLLPSKIFASPIEYAKDIKQDVVNIKKAAQGKANDHELGRINDLAMKIGSGVLAAYLFVKNPLKLGKTMEFIGAGTFFASMALWPKLFIQAPIKARTGVDIHQKYIDSQGRKKMLHQDPQYDLTDLYSKEDLDKMGRKLKVNENLPDRNRFIKQRAKKTAVQGNTLWMLTAGFATPLGSALMCNALEKPVSKVIEKANMLFADFAMNNTDAAKRAKKADTAKIVEKAKRATRAERAENAFVRRFVTKNGQKPLTENLIDELTIHLTQGFGNKTITDGVREELRSLSKPEITSETVKSILQACGVDSSIFDGLSKLQKENMIAELKAGNKKVFSQFVKANNGSSKKIADELAKLPKRTVADVKGRIQDLGEILAEAKSGNKVINRFISSRVGKQQSTYIANQWNKTTRQFVRALGLSSKELKAVSKGQTEIIDKKLTELAANPEKYEKIIDKLSKAISGYEKTTGKSFIDTISAETDSVFNKAAKSSKELFPRLAEIFGAEGKGSARNAVVSNAADRALGAKASFIRMFQTLGIYKQAPAMEQGLAQDCKNVLLNATLTDYTEKFTSKGFNIGETGRFKDVCESIYRPKTSMFGDKVPSKVKEIVSSHSDDVINNVINSDAGFVSSYARKNLGSSIDIANGCKKNSLVGQSVKDTIVNTAKDMYNSQKWLKIFGGAFIALTAVTLIAGLAIGKKGETEKQAEEGLKVNG